MQHPPWRNHFFILLLFFCLGNADGQTTRGTSFWLSYIENLNLGFNGPPSFFIYVQSEVATTGTIVVHATNFELPFEVTPGAPVRVDLPQSILYTEGSEKVDKKGLHIITQAPVSIWAHHYRPYFSESSIVLPEEMLGSSYSVITHKHDLGGLSEFVVVATADNTIVDIVPKSATSGLRPAEVSFSVTLQKGESYQVQAFGELTGTTIVARDRKKLAVFSGATYAEVFCGATSHLYDQAYPDEVLGSSYVLTPFRTSTMPDKFRVLALYDSTFISFNCESSFLIKAGQFGDFNVGDATHMKTSKPVAVGQFKAGMSCSGLGDCTFMMNAPADYIATSTSFSTHSGSEFSEHTLLVVCRNEYLGTLLLDNNPVTAVPVHTASEYVWNRIPIGPGVHNLTCPGGFHASLAGFGSYDAYSHFLGSSGTDPASEEKLHILLTDSVCTPGVAAFITPDSLNFNRLTWTLDGMSANGPRITDSIRAPGQYRVFVSGTDGSGCFHSSSKLVEFEACKIIPPHPPDTTIVVELPDDCEVFVPTAFAPDGSSANSMACVFSVCIATIDFMIFDRWGELVFRTNDPKICWDGIYKNTRLTTAVFGWSLKATLRSGREVKNKGHITLIR